MASPVLPSRPASGGGTPVGLPLGSEAGEAGDGFPGDGGSPAAVLAKRNLMDVLRSREAGGAPQGRAAQHQQHILHQQAGHPHLGRQQPGLATRHSSGGRPAAAQHLQPWQRQRQAAFPPAAASGTKATHVSLAQLLAAPAAGGEPKPDMWGRPAGGGMGRQPSTGAKRGRDALGVSRTPSGALGGKWPQMCGPLGWECGKSFGLACPGPVAPRLRQPGRAGELSVAVRSPCAFCAACRAAAPPPQTTRPPSRPSARCCGTSAGRRTAARTCTARSPRFWPPQVPAAAWAGPPPGEAGTAARQLLRRRPGPHLQTWRASWAAARPQALGPAPRARCNGQ